MTEFEQAHNQNFAPSKMSPEGVRVLEKGVVYELPAPAKESFGLAAVLDIGGKLPDPNFDYGEIPDQHDVKETDFKMLLAIDLRADGSEKWVQGCDVPEGAAAALVDPKGLKVDQEGRVTEGIVFLSPGSALIVGRGRYREGDPQSNFRRLSVDAPAVSYKHLDIGVDRKGAIAIRDRNSTSGTIVSTGEAARDAVNEIGEHHEHHLRFKRILGEEATEQVIAEPEVPVEELVPSLQEVLSREESLNKQAATKRLEQVLGANKMGGGALGDALRKLGSDPEAILSGLHEKGEAQHEVLAVLERRVRQLYESKDAGGKPNFLPGVDENRTKDVAADCSRFGEVREMPSLEYVAQIAYDMLSGDFNLKTGKSDGDVRDGNHRDAAEKVVADFAKEQVVQTEALHAENERVEQFFRAATESLRSIGNDTRGKIVPVLMNLQNAFYGEMVNGEMLMQDVARVEQERRELESRVKRLLVDCRRLQTESDSTISPEDMRRLGEAESEIKTIDTTLDFRATSQFWNRIVGEATSGAYDSMSLRMFREQIVRHGAAQQIAEDLLRGVIAVAARYV